MDLKEIKLKSLAELKSLLAEMREKLRDLRFKLAQDSHKDVREIRVVKKTIARILTLIKIQEVKSPAKK
ncbi:MAG: 50S ribosomal protein L29 [Candidatus Kerfeldbacteria bacterium CG08_land_8_20_14_0_20_43_14]|uniref:Large ribosomal subunit protein uL29 n=1 Tax=Candidatus Kerfeldbacteria bacterium CG08_land_8_20_14_0_20_43_14 TaxID=2014246 RepID=A0A2H0YRW5_9BACT|nr:MAG: 50S ribosomal protein L29 [Candidatus Kerfeldbacteria bacterium CG08_land_8_20_14_0_20_43_14]